MGKCCSVILAGILMLAGPATGRADDNDLRKKIERLEAENEALKDQLVKLRKELATLRSTAKNKPSAAKPTYTDKSGDGRFAMKYVLEGVSRSGREVTFRFTATLQKGGRQRSANYFHMKAVDNSGESHHCKLNERGAGRYGLLNVRFEAGVATKIELKVDLPEEVESLRTVTFTEAAVGRPAIRLSKIAIPK